MVQVGDRIRVLRDRANLANVKKGDEFIVDGVYNKDSIRVEGTPKWAFRSDSYEVISTAPPKDPIEYLKAAHADGDMIDPATMFRECYGITKTERVVVEWSEATKRKIKVGDKVRIVGPLNFGEESIEYPLGSMAVIDRIDMKDTLSRYCIEGLWFPASSVELI